MGAVAYATGTRSISKLSGLSRSLPVAAACFFLGAFALTGIPPLACFWSKMYVLAGALQVKGAFGPIVLIFVLIESLITFGWFLWVGQKVFFGTAKLTQRAARSRKGAEQEAVGDQPAGVAALPATIQWTLIAVALLTLVIPIVGIPIVSGLFMGR